MRDHLVFYVNGVRHAAGGREASLTLSDYLRMGCGAVGASRLTGTKVACAEGDCGACTVLVGRPSADGRELEYVPIDACIAFVYQLDRTHVVTVEGIAAEGQLSPVQRAMVDCHGSQCGFCTPGFVMAMHGLVENCRGADDGRRLADDELRLGLSGNLCRCTGYAQILEAGAAIPSARVARMESQFDSAAMLRDFASLGAKAVHVNPPVSAEANGKPAGPERLERAAVEIFLPSTLGELLAQRAARPQSTLVSGATDLGVQVNHRKLAPVSVIATQGVPELHRLEIECGEFVVGAAVRWARFAEFIRDCVPEYKAVLDRFGSPQIRQMGTLVGNLANASPIADSIPFHFVAESMIELSSVDGQRSVPIEKFYLGYKQLDLRPDEVITAVRAKLPAAGTHLKLYKISRRRDLDISTVTAAFLLEMDDAGEVIRTARIAVGGVGPMVLRLRRAEASLAGQPLELAALRTAGRLASEEISPISDVRGSDTYRYQLVENLFQKFYFDRAPSALAPT